MICRGLAVEAQVALAAGEVAPALAAAKQSLDLVPKRDSGDLAAMAGSVCGAALLASGEAEEAGKVLVRCGGGENLPLVWPAQRAAFYGLLVEAELVQGHPLAAACWAERAEEAAQAVALALPTAAAGRARAAVLLASHRPDEAAAVALVAADAGDRVGATIPASLARVLTGRALAAAGHRAEAIAHLRMAEAALASCGAAGHRAEVLRHLRHLGRRGAAQGSGQAGQTKGALTARESEIARLVADNKTNREVAAELYISEKTVETHLSHIFTRLGISSRRALRRVLERAEG